MYADAIQETVAALTANGFEVHQASTPAMRPK